MDELRDTRILLTASEAYPALETCVAEARDTVTASFRIFDPFTWLRSEAGRALGRDWFDLIVAKLRDGLRITLYLADFDPVARPALHRQTWASLRALWAAGEVAGAPDRLVALPMMHPARAGAISRFMIWPKSLGKLRDRARALSLLEPVVRRRALDESPALARLLSDDGRRPLRWPPPPLVPATHHQKLAVIDERWLYIGGLDLDERRYDTPDHERAAEETWHDVQILTRGAVVARAQAHLDTYGAICRGGAISRPGGAFLRTVSSKRRGRAAIRVSPRKRVVELEDAYLDGIAGARNLIYLETQFLRSRRIAAALAMAARREPELHLLVVLPAAPEDVAFEGNRDPDARFGEFLQARAVTRIGAAFGARAFFASPARPAWQTASRYRRDNLHGAPIVYVHAKIAAFDGQRALVSSANLNGRSLHWDTEAGVMMDDPALARQLLERCLGHWRQDADWTLIAGDGASVVAEIRAAAQADRARSPAERRSLILPYAVGPARRFGRNLPGLPEAMV